MNNNLDWKYFTKSNDSYWSTYVRSVFITLSVCVFITSLYTNFSRHWRQISLVIGWHISLIDVEWHDRRPGFCRDQSHVTTNVTVQVVQVGESCQTTKHFPLYIFKKFPFIILEMRRKKGWRCWKNHEPLKSILIFVPFWCFNNKYIVT